MNEKMTRIIVDVISIRDLRFPNNLSHKDPYLKLQVGNEFINQSYKTETHKNLGDDEEIKFGETYEFDVEKYDNLKVRLFDDELIGCEEIGEAKIPLREVVESGSMESWYPLGEGSNYNGEVHLKIHTY